ncbi:hypothetical protein [Azorhizobium doebereinerae]|uniref:hypothetical protein n=1 Tax=Azorhizobium doebereinerae TaxID=281091 RepID=UPI0012EBA7FA|nr:hypothetical protein [Azorhizobium doebereinerae]
MITTSPNSDAARLQATMPVEIGATTALLVLTPACDLQRDGAPRILLLVGKIETIGASSWTYGEDARTAAIQLGADLRWGKWNLKHIDTISHEQLEKAFGDGDLVTAAACVKRMLSSCSNGCFQDLVAWASSRRCLRPFRLIRKSTMRDWMVSQPD